jgi:dipeptidyl aminopeptidase/acylaminoacyl peptidase
MDADGGGELSAPFPMDVNTILPPLLSDLLSPDGAWLAFYTGSAGPAFDQPGPTTADLTLKLMSLFNSKLLTGDSQLVTRLLSADYPANFDTAASQLGITDLTPQALRDSFVAGITQSIAWSPDGTLLAFAGQMDGLSSDLYLYDANSGAIQRLSSGPQEVEWIDWSPDGKWVLDGSTYFVGEGMSYDVYATSTDGKVTRKLLTDYHLVGDVTWIDGNDFLTYQSENGPGNYGLERVNVGTGKIDMIRPDSFGSFLLDPQGSWLAVFSPSGDLALVDLATLKQTAVSLPGPAHAFGSGSYMASLNPGADRHFIFREDDASDWYYLSTGGVSTPATIDADLVSVAPDQQHWVALKDALQLYTSGSGKVSLFALPPGMQAGDFQSIIWRPDSSGIFLVSTSSQLYALDFSSGEYSLVEQNLAAAGSGHFMTSAGPAGLIWVHSLK